MTYTPEAAGLDVGNEAVRSIQRSLGGNVCVYVGIGSSGCW